MSKIPIRLYSINDTEKSAKKILRNKLNSMQDLGKKSYSYLPNYLVKLIFNRDILGLFICYVFKFDWIRRTGIISRSWNKKALVMEEINYTN